MRSQRLISPTGVRLARLLRGLRQSDLASLAGVDQTLISRLETGGGRVSARTKEKLARALDLPIQCSVPEVTERERDGER